MTYSQVPRVAETNIRIQTIVVAAQTWEWSVSEIADQYNLSEAQVEEVLSYYQAHRQVIDAAIAIERELELAVYS